LPRFLLGIANFFLPHRLAGKAPPANHHAQINRVFKLKKITAPPMRRYLYDHSTQESEPRHHDVIIAGAGLAGLYASLLLDERLSVALLVKDRLMQCNSSLAQGGVAAVTRSSDHTQKHLDDTLKAAKGLANEAHVRLMVEQGPGEIRQLADLGVPFDIDHRGDYYTTREGGHTEKRVLHCGGDATGEHIMQALIRKVREKANVQLMENCFLLDVLTTHNGEACGVAVTGKETTQLLAPHVIIATGGIGQAYQNTTNQPGITGDGIAAALRAGALAKHMEFVQFHPTAFFDTSEGKTAFLISEAVRGEGGLLRNHKGEAFMEKYHPMKDLAPRDVVSRAIATEMHQAGKPMVFLDITHHSRDFLSRRFPTIFNNCRAKGLDMSREALPVAPSQHYIMGGIHTDSKGRTNIPGLYVAGEAACTEVHGANRLASNSLLECLVFSRRCATHINHSKPPINKLQFPQTLSSGPAFDGDTGTLRQEIKSLMQIHGGIVRHGEGMKYAISKIQEKIAPLEQANMRTIAEAETYNIGLIALEVLQAALKRKRSVGAHFRTD